MTLYREDSIQYFTLSDPQGQVLWSMKGPLSAEAAAGMIAALHVMTNDHLVEMTFDSNEFLIVNLNDPYLAVQSFLGQREVPAYKLAKYPGPTEGYGWWIGKKGAEYYDMYLFTSGDFPQTFISIADHLHVEFRNYIAGPPFQYNSIQKRNVNHAISGYDIAPFNPMPRRPASPAPFYTNTNADEADFAALNYV